MTGRGSYVCGCGAATCAKHNMPADNRIVVSFFFSPIDDYDAADVHSVRDVRATCAKGNRTRRDHNLGQGRFPCPLAAAADAVYDSFDVRDPRQ